MCVCVCVCVCVCDGRRVCVWVCACVRACVCLTEVLVSVYISNFMADRAGPMCWLSESVSRLTADSNSKQWLTLSFRLPRKVPENWARSARRAEVCVTVYPGSSTAD